MSDCDSGGTFHMERDETLTCIPTDLSAESLNALDELLLLLLHVGDVLADLCGVEARVLQLRRLLVQLLELLHQVLVLQGETHVYRSTSATLSASVTPS